MYLFLSAWFSFFFVVIVNLIIRFPYEYYFCIFMSPERQPIEMLGLCWHTLEIQEQMVFSTNLFTHSHKGVPRLPLR